MANSQTVLITGAGGVIGMYAAKEYATGPGWQVLAVSRRTPADIPEGSYEHVKADLLQQESLQTAIATRAGSITRLVFAAYMECDNDPVAQVEANVAILKNTVLALVRAGAPLEHVTLFQGAKAYGAHLGKFRTPARESEPRILGPNFYFNQEDELRALATRYGFALTVLRPDAIIGYTVGTPMNLLMNLAVYASICKELGLPLRCPFGDRGCEGLLQVTDSELLGRATIWAAGSENAKDEIFNVTNGDHFRFRHLWPVIARNFDMDVDEPLRMSISQHMIDKPAVWSKLVARHGLRPTPWSDLVNFAFLDGLGQLIESGVEVLTSTVKIRTAGFGDCYDTFDRFGEWFDRLRRAKVIPSL